MLLEVPAIQSAVVVVLSAAAVSCLLRAFFLLLYRVPAKAELTYDGYRRACDARNAAVFLHERAPLPFTVEDQIGFRTAEGQRVHVTVRRYAKPHDRTQLVWYSPVRPQNISTNGPLYWFGWAFACLGTIVLLFHT